MILFCPEVCFNGVWNCAGKAIVAERLLQEANMDLACFRYWTLVQLTPLQPGCKECPEESNTAPSAAVSC